MSEKSPQQPGNKKPETDSLQQIELPQSVPATSTTTNEPLDKTTEHGGPKGPEPTRYGDWERNGRCTDF